MPWVATTSFETKDGTTAPTRADQIVATGDGSGWSGNWTDIVTGTDWQYRDDFMTPLPGGNGTWAARVANSGAVNQAMDRTLTTAVTSGIVSFWIGATDVAGDFRVMLKNANGTQWYIRLNNSITLVGTTTQTIVGTAVNSTWYQIHVSFENTTDTAKARENSQTSWTATVASSVANGDTTKLEIRTVNNGAGASTLFDNIGVGSNPAVGGHNLMSLMGVG